ncbi:hypothetical protein [Pseudomonas frederiksbergensis]|uniref:hypothetical protein n=1 Tax=Pseudomonas frederiksbergensis TaxID=104087 RepID=UPI0011CDD878|nr:hypothetical protein [Pseudomonas frederiksbergensis]
MSLSDIHEGSEGVLLADAPTVDGVPESDLEGKLPAEVLLNGGQARVKRWPVYADQPGEVDELTVFWRREGITTTLYQERKNGPITETEFLIPITVDLLQGDGIAYLWYRVRPIPGNPVNSVEKKLTIDHSVIPLPQLSKVDFPDATPWGYLNCVIKRPIWLGVYINIPFQGLRADDECVYTSRGYSSLNGGDQYFLDGTEGVFTYTLTAADANNMHGFEPTPIPFTTYLDRLIKDSSLGVSYKIRRRGVFIGTATEKIVKVDRTRSGDTPCGPS